MKYLIGLLAVFVGITTVSFSLGQVKRPQVELAPDALMSDHDRIEKLRLEVAELQGKLAALNQKYDAHTHRLRLGITRVQRQITCDIRDAYDHKICRQIGDDYVSVTMAGSMQTMVTAPPGP